jgi:carbon monoxide dehydrogenase subunit G
MIHIEESTQISRPRDEVFDFLTNVDNLPKWQSGVIQSKALSQGPVRVGYQFEETAKVGPWKLHNLCTVSDLKPNERFAFEAKSSGPLDYQGSFDLQPVARGTRLTLSGSARLKGLWRLLQPVLAGDLRKETKTEMEAIRRQIEAQPSISAPSAERRSQPVQS